MLNSQFIRHLLVFQQVDMKMQSQFHELDTLNGKFMRFEDESMSRDLTRSNQLEKLIDNLGTMKNKLEYQQDFTESIFYFKKNQLQKLTEEQLSQKKESIKMGNEVQESFNCHLKENLTHFAELNNNCNIINQKFTLFTNDLQHHNNLFDKLNIELEQFKTQKDQLKTKFEYVVKEVDDRVSNSTFNRLTEKIEANHLKDYDVLRLELSHFRREFDSSMYTMQETQENIVVEQSRETLMLDQIKTSFEQNQTEYNEKFNFFSNNFRDFKQLLTSLEEQNKRQLKELQDSQNIQLNSIQASTRKEFLRLNQDLQIFREKITIYNEEQLAKIIPEIKEQMSKEIEELCKQVAEIVYDSKRKEQEANLREAAVQVTIESEGKDSIQITHLQDQLFSESAKKIMSQPNEQIKRNHTLSSNSKRNNAQVVQVQSINYEVINDMIEKQVSESLNDALTSSPYLYEQIRSMIEKQKIDLIEIIQKEVNILKKVTIQSSRTLNMLEFKKKSQESQNNINSSQNKVSQDSQNIIQMMEQIEEMKAEILILIEMRSEIDQTILSQNLEFKKSDEKVNRFNNSMLKIKSDFFTETQYMNNQMRQLFKHKDSLQFKLQSLTSLISLIQESLYIIYSILLSKYSSHTSQLPFKFSSSAEGLIFELAQKTDALYESNQISYRNNKYSISELLKQTFLGNIELWNSLWDSSMQEIKENHPLSSFKLQIIKSIPMVGKQSIAVGSPMDLAKTSGEFHKKFYDPLLSARETKRNNFRIQNSTPRQRESMTVNKFIRQEKIRDTFSLQKSK